MKQIQQFTALIERENEGYVSLYPELDIASQGKTVEEARVNLIEAIELFLKPLTRQQSLPALARTLFEN